MQLRTRERKRNFVLLLVAWWSLCEIASTFENENEALSLEYCQFDEQCVKPRLCRTVSVSNGTSTIASCDGRSLQCFCRDANIIPCTTSKECMEGERCIRWSTSSKTTFTMCASCRVAQVPPNITFVDGPNTIPLPDFPESGAEVEQTQQDGAVCKRAWTGGYSGDRCTLYYPNCVAPRVCQQLVSNDPVGDDEEDDTAVANNVWSDCLFDDKPCFCWRPVVPSCGGVSDAPCDIGEQCVYTNGINRACYSCNRVMNDPQLIPFSDNSSCYLPTVSPSVRSTPSSTASLSPSPSVTSSISASPTIPPSPPPPLIIDESGPCIHADALAHLSFDDLVFRSHIRANVLCDKYGSCATPGHIIIFCGRAMRMSTYCRTSIAQCTHRRNAWVNSPRMRRAWRLSSRTPHFHYSAFSARYNTRIEELLIQILFRIGL